MAEVVEIPDFVKGKKTRRGEPLPPEEMPQPELVTAVAPAVIDAFLRARSYGERIRHLRELRDEGMLIHSKGRLTQALRGHDVDRAYVFRGCVAGVPSCGSRGVRLAAPDPTPGQLGQAGWMLRQRRPAAP